MNVLELLHSACITVKELQSQVKTFSEDGNVDELMVKVCKSFISINELNFSV